MRRMLSNRLLVGSVLAVVPLSALLALGVMAAADPRPAGRAGVAAPDTAAVPAPTARAALAITLDEVPDKLVLPLEASANHVVTATIGGEAAEVFLARAADAPYKVPLA